MQAIQNLFLERICLCQLRLRITKELVVDLFEEFGLRCRLVGRGGRLQRLEVTGGRGQKQLVVIELLREGVARPDDSLEAAGEAEVTDLDRAVVINQDVRWLQVSVDDLGFVQVIQATQDVVHYRFHLGFLKMLGRFQKLL